MRIVGNKSTLSSDYKLKQAFEKVPRFCYRKSFVPILNSNLTTDKGWGCCLRSSQGIIAQFVLQIFNKNPEKYNSFFGEGKDPLSLFFDSPDAPFGIHNIVKFCAECGLEPGHWAKPSIAALAYKKIFDELNIGCVLCHNFSFFKSEFNTNFPALVLIPGLYGMQNLDLSCIPFLLACLCSQNSLGLVSGKRNSAFFIAGFVDNQFVYFDPHTTKNALLNIEDSQSVYSIEPKFIKFKNINPSILIGFICHTASDLENTISSLMYIDSSPISIIEPNDSILSQVLDIDDL